MHYLLEVGTEELPASFITQALCQWQQKIPASLAEQGLVTSEIFIWATPRRLAVILAGLPEKQADQTKTIKGPAVTAGAKAVAGFARSRGLNPADLIVETSEQGVAYYYAQLFMAGRACGEILQQLAPAWITGLEGKRLMRWADGSLRFSRPIRWLVSLLDTEILPITLENLTSDRISYGHRVLHAQPLTLTSALTYEAQLKAAFVWVNPQSRRIYIEQLLHETAAQLEAETEIPVDLLTEVNHLVEWPTVVVGHFDKDFLTLPPPVIKTEMISHQRYFPVHKMGQATQLLPKFLSVSNGDPQYGAIIAQGNSRVLKARLWDGKFFYTEDRKQTLEAFLTNLQQVTFQEKLGSLAERVERIKKLARYLAEHLHVTEDEKVLIARTAHLCKADLTTQMVKEFPELQGIMGYYYAVADGEDAQVALGIQEHYQPRFFGDALPTTLAGKVVALAERMELITSIFSIGQLPTGSSDPYGLRRAVLGMIQIIGKNQFVISIDHVIIKALRNLTDNTDITANTLGAIQEFYRQRLQGFLIEQENLDYDLVYAALAGGQTRDNITDIIARTQLLQAMRHAGQLEKVYETVNRVIRLAASSGLVMDTLVVEDRVQPQLFEDEIEVKLFNLMAEFPNPEILGGDYIKLFEYIVSGIETISDFFTNILIMSEDPAIRTNRLNLLGVLRNQYLLLADFSKIVIGGN